MALVGMASKPLHVRRLQKSLQEWVANPCTFLRLKRNEWFLFSQQCYLFYSEYSEISISLQENLYLGHQTQTKMYSHGFRGYESWIKEQEIILPTVKFLNFRTPENFAVIYLKFKKRGQTSGYFVKKMQME